MTSENIVSTCHSAQEVVGSVPLAIVPFLGYHLVTFVEALYRLSLVLSIVILLDQTCPVKIYVSWKRLFPSMYKSSPPVCSLSPV